MKSVLTLVLFFFLIPFFSALNAQTLGDYQTVASGNWNDLSVWQRYNGSVWDTPSGAEGYPGQFVGTQSVTIVNDFHIDLNVSPAHDIQNLIIGTGNKASYLTFIGTNSLVVADNTTIDIPTFTSASTYKYIKVLGGALTTKNLTMGETVYDGRDCYIEISSGSVSVTNNIEMNASKERNYILFSGNGVLNVGKTISGGTITSTIGGGDAAPTSGTVVYNGVAAQNIGEYQYYHLAVNNPSTVDLIGDVKVSNTLDLMQGVLNLNSNTLHLSGALVRTGAAIGKIKTTSSSNIIVDGSGVIPLFYFHDSDVTINNLTINRVGANIDLDANLSISGVLTLSNGIITTGSKNLTIVNTDATAVVGGGTGAYVNGSLIRSISTADTYFFPVGDNSGCGYHNLNILDATDVNASTSVKVGFISNGASTVDDVTLTSINPFNWQVTLLAGTLTKAKVVVYGAEILSDNALGKSNTQSGDYSKLIGTTAVGNIAVPDVDFPALGASVWLAVGGAAVKTFYSYQNGNWNNPLTWTLDPSGTTFYNPGDKCPTENANVYILNGRTVYAKNIDGTADIAVKANQLTIENGAVLDLTTASAHAFSEVFGKGKIRINSTAFPLGDFTDFVSSDGGTVEFYDVTGALPTPATPAETFNNLSIIKTTDNATNYTITLQSNLTLNGNLEIARLKGTGNAIFTIGNNATVRNLTVNGDMTIGANCTLTVGGTALHRITSWGSLYNNGVLNFNKNGFLAANTAGAANILFKGETNSEVRINANTRFYGFAVDKGADWSSVLSVTSDESVTPFTGVYTDDDVIYINKGTCKLGKNITISNLQDNTGNYNLGSASNFGACLWIDGAEVVTHSSALVVYGRFRISGGSFNVNSGQRAIVTRFNGELIVEGGELRFKQFRPSTSTGEVPRGSYTQTGGRVIAEGISSSPAFTLFCFPHPETSFVMSGGEIDIYDCSVSDAGKHGGLLIGCNNYQITGGTVNVYSSKTGGVNFNINSTVPFWNLNLYAQNAGNKTFTSTSQVVAIDGISSPVPARPLVVLNDLLVSGTNGTIFKTLGNDVFVAGDFIIEAGATYESGANTVTLNGTDGQEFRVNGTIDGGLNNFSLSNTTATVLTGSGITINGSFSINPYCSFDDGGFSVNAKGSIINSGTHISSGSGKVILNATAAQQQISGNGNGIFGNLQLNNPLGAKLSAKQTITGNLILTDGVLDIDIYRLNLYSNKADAISVVSPNANCMIRTAGNQSDGGVLKIFSTNESFTFPVGTANNYTPATFAVDAAVFGNIIVKPVATTQPFAVLPAKAIKKYWKVESVYFSGVSSVVSSFIYDDSEIQGDESVYYSAYYQPFAFTTSNVSPNNVDGGSNTIHFSTGSFIDAEYTAGEQDAFSTVQTFYSRQDGDWNNPATWSNVEVGGVAASSFPDSKSPVVIGDGLTKNHIVSVPTGVSAQSGSLILNTGSVLDLGISTGNNFGALSEQQVGGTGTMRISSATATAQFPAGDFGAFIGANGGTVEYYTSGTAFTIPETSYSTSLNLNTYCNLNVMADGQQITMPDVSLTIHNDMTCGSASYQGNVALNSVSVTTLNIKNNLKINGGKLQYHNKKIQNVVVGNDISVADNSTFEVLSIGAVVANTLTLNGSVVNNGDFIFRNGSAYTNLIFKGNSNELFTGTNASAQTTLNLLTVNKGTSQSAMLTMNVAGGLTTLDNNWLTLTNGTFMFAKTSGNITLTKSAVAYTIPGTACLAIDAGATVSIGMYNDNAADLILNGKLDIRNGTVNVGNVANNKNNDIEYASAGSPEISLGANAMLVVAGQIRSNISNNAGSLIYNQTGGELVVWGKSAVAGKPKLGVYNSGSIFNMSDGIIRFKNGAGTTYADLYLRPSSSTVTGGTIVFDAQSASTTFKVDVAVPIHNVTILGNLSSAVSLSVNPLVLSGSLLIEYTNKLISNDLDVTIGGDFTNSGVYIQGENTTIFNGSANQVITCNSPTVFYKMLINKSSGVLSLGGANAPTVNSIFTLVNGFFDTKNLNLILLSDAVNNGTHLSSGVGAIVFSGTVGQEVSGNGLGKFANITLNNPANVEFVADMTITKNLSFSTGYLFIGDKLLSFSADAPNPTGYSTDRFIVTNGVASDAGVRKYIGGGSSSFFVPVGSLSAGMTKYTPVEYTYSNLVGTDAFLQIKPVNSKHLATTDEFDKELKYYWKVITSGISSFTSLTQEFIYQQVDVNGIGSEANYYSGFLPNGSTSWLKQSIVDAGSNVISFTNSTDISGDYTAGEDTELGQICIYKTRADGDWNNPLTWKKDCSGSGVFVDCVSLGDYPKGNPVIIDHEVVATENGCLALSLVLNGKLTLGATVGHNFVVMSGAGHLSVSPNGSGAFVFPGGDNSAFMQTTGSTIEYNSTGGTTISPVITSYQNLMLSGNGDKSLANIDLLVRGNLILADDCGLFSNIGFNRNITLLGNWENNSATAYEPGLGSVFFNGTFLQIVGGNCPIGEVFNNVFVNNSIGVRLDRNIDVDNDFTISANSIFNANSKNINIQGDWINNSTSGFWPNNGTVVFDGVAAQTYRAAATETFHNITINNTKGVSAVSATNITGVLKFENGFLDIGSYGLNLSLNASITGATTDRFIQTAGKSSDAGVSKDLSGTYNFTFPIGVAGKYTPAAFKANTNGGAGKITVIPVNVKHPFANNNITDELQYYWITKSSGFTSVNVNHSYTFAASDAKPSTLDYVAARFFGGTWVPSEGGEAGTNVVSPIVTYTNKNYIDGEYTCGRASNFGGLVTYYSRSGATDIASGAAWMDLQTWSTLGHDDNIYIPNTLPNRNPVVIKEGHKVVVADNGINLASLELNGDLNINATSGHDFGSITGIGKLTLVNNSSNNFVLPAANIAAFCAPNGGTIEFDGVGSLPSNSIYNNIEFSSNGAKNLPDVDLLVNGNLIINAGQINNTYKRNLTLKGNWYEKVDSKGLNSVQGKVVFAGAVNQFIEILGDGKFFDIEINNPTNITLLSPVEISNNLSFVNGKINTSAVNILTLSNTNATAVAGAGVNSYVNGPMKKEMAAGSNFVFPVGKTSYGYVAINNASGGTWVAEYFDGNYNSANFDSPLVLVSDKIYWRVQSLAANQTAIVRVPYDKSGFGEKCALVEYSSVDSKWNNDMGSVASVAQKTVTSISALDFDGDVYKYFSVGTTNLVLWVGLQSTDWNEPANWNTGKVPDDNDNVKIVDLSANAVYYYPLIETNETIASLNIEDVNAQLTVGSGTLTVKSQLTNNGDIDVLSGTLYVDGVLENNGNMSVKSTATATGSLINKDVINGSGTFNIQRYIWSQRYQDVSSPVKQAPTSIFLHQKSLRTAVEPDWTDALVNNPGYKYITGGNLEPATGYVLFVWGAQTINFSCPAGQLNTGNYEFKTSRVNTKSHTGVNLVGNPYPSGLSVGKFLTENAAGIENFVYMWDEPASGIDYTNNGYTQVSASGISTGGYQVGYDGDRGGTGSSNTGILYLGQGFYVTSLQDGYSVKFNNDMRVANDNASYYYKSGVADYSVFQLALVNEKNSFNDFVLAFADDASDKFDFVYDVEKIKNTDFYVYSKFLDSIGHHLAIQGLKRLKSGSAKTIPLGYYTKTAGMYKFDVLKIEDLYGLDVYLHDKLENKTIDIRNNIYEFKTNAGTFDDRFEIVFRPAKGNSDVADADEIEDNLSDEQTDDTDVDDTENTGNDNPVNDVDDVTGFGSTENGVKHVDVYGYQKHIYVRLNGLNLTNAKIFVYNQTGSALTCRDFNSDSSDFDFNNPAGIYLVKIVADNYLMSKLIMIE